MLPLIFSIILNVLISARRQERNVEYRKEHETNKTQGEGLTYCNWNLRRR